MSDKKKMAFYQLQKGKLAIDFQAAFEDAQKQTMLYGDVSKVSLEITVHPPESRNDKYGSVMYKIKKSLPAVKSMKMTTELSPLGYIINEGRDVDDIIQLDLDLKEPKIHQVNGEN